jgi:hypothetical protein
MIIPGSLLTGNDVLYQHYTFRFVESLMSNKRIVKDSMGELEVPEEACYGAQTQRAIENFPVSGLTMPEALVLWMPGNIRLFQRPAKR